MALLETPTTAKIERLIRSWRTDNPAFFWCPTKPSNFFLDQQRRVQGRPSGRVDVGYGGVKVAVPNGDSYLSFPTTLGLSTNGNFLCMLLVYIKDPANVTGSFLKIGSGSDGVSIGGGITTHEDSGSKLILLRETFAWDRSPANAFVPGMNVLSFYFTTNGVLGGLNHTTGGGVDVTPGGTVYLAPTVSTSINGAGGTRGSNATVCAVAIWPEAYDNTATVAKRAMLSAGLDRLSGRPYLPLFTPERAMVPVSAGGALSASIAESASASDTSSAGLSAPVSRAEAASASDTSSALKITTSAVAESGSTNETTSALRTHAAGQAEVGGATETANGLKATASAAAEAVTCAETNSVSMAAASTRAETATAAESQDASVTSASGASCAESAGANDASGTSLATAASVAEAAAAADSRTASNATIASQVEAGASVEASASLRLHAAAAAESASSADTSLAVASGSVSSVSETATASDVSNAVAAFLAAMIESAASQDIASAVSSGDVTPVPDDATGYYRRAAAVIMAEGALGPSDYVMLAIGARRSTH